jgi:hypothetical protein
VSYALFCTDAPDASRKMPPLCRKVLVDSASLGVAIDTACELISRGVIVWKLVGSEGYTMERADIEIERARRRELRADTSRGRASIRLPK